MSSSMNFYLIAVALCLSLANAMFSKDPTLDLQDPSSPRELEVNTIEESGEQTCQMEVQVTKLVTGRCISLGRKTRVCIAGNSMYPFHHQCM